MIRIRRFIQTEDEEMWLGIWNEAYKEYDDYRPALMEDFEKAEKSPGFDPTGMLIAEWEGNPVGFVNAFIDKERKEKKGFLRVLGVHPEYRRRGIGRALAEKALESLKARGMETVQAWTQDDRPQCKGLYESLGFKLIRVHSTMRRNLKAIPSEIGERKELELRIMKMDDPEDVKLFWKLDNEAFKEHFNFRPRTLEEVEFELREKPWCDIMEHYFASQNGEPVGFIGVGIDSRYVKHSGVHRGYVLTIGVLKPTRRQGVGTALMLQGMKALKFKGITEVELGVDDTNPTKAIELYKKVGFQTARKDLTYLKSL
jgi:mycothiol synthase